MIAMLIGSFLVAAAVQIYLGSIETARFQTAQARVQETGRFAMSKLAKDIRGSGYQGCTRNAVNPAKTQNIVNGQSKSDFLDEPVRGYTADASGLPEAIQNADPPPNPDTEILTARTSVVGDKMQITGNPSGRNIKVSNAETISKGDIVMATDCQSTTIFQVTSQGANGNSLTYGSGKSVSPGNNNKADVSLSDGSVYRSRTLAYYIADDDAPTLYRVQIPPDNSTAEPQKMASNVSRLSFEFGVDTSYDSTIDDYKSVDAVNNWDDVLAIRVSIIAASNQDNVINTDDTQEFTFPPGSSNTVSYSDQRLREVFTTIVKLRNQI